MSAVTWVPSHTRKVACESIEEGDTLAYANTMPEGRFWQSHHPHKMAQTGSSPTFPTTKPYLLPVSFAQRITAAQLQYLLAFDSNNPFTTFAYCPYSQKLQRKLKANPEYTKFRFKIPA